MGNYFVWFPIPSVVVIYILSVNCQHMKDTTIGTDNVAQLYTKLRLVDFKGKNIKTDHTKRFVQAYLPDVQSSQNIPVVPNERVSNINQYTGVQFRTPIMYGVSKNKKRQIENGNTTLQEKTNVLGRQQEIEANTTLNNSIKETDQQNVRIVVKLNLIESKLNDSLNESASVELQSLDVQPLPQEITVLHERKSNETVESRGLVLPTTGDEYGTNETIADEVRSFEGQHSNTTVPNSDGPLSFDYGSLDEHAVSQAISALNESQSNESVSVIARSLNVLQTQALATLIESESNKPVSVKSRSLDALPSLALNESDINESAPAELRSWDLQTLPQTLTALNGSESDEFDSVKSRKLNVLQVIKALNESDSNDTASVEALTLDMLSLLLGNTTFNESRIQESLLVAARSFDILFNPQGMNAFNDTTNGRVSGYSYDGLDELTAPPENTTLNQPNSEESVSVDSRSSDMLPVPPENTTSFETLSVDVLPVAQRNTTLTESNSSDSRAVESLSFDVLSALQRNTTLAESNISDSRAFESLSFDAHKNPQENMTVNEPENSQSDYVEVSSLNELPESQGLIPYPNQGETSRI